MAANSSENLSIAACREILGVSNLLQLEARAREPGKLTQMAFDYYASGADDEETLNDNRASFSRFALIPRMLKDVSGADTSVRVLGCNMAAPIIVAPMAMHQLAHPDGELATARAAKAAGVPMVVSTMANYDVEQVAGAAGAQHLWFQLYVFRNRQLARTLVRAAESSGYRALVVTVDAPRLGTREADERNGFQLPADMALGNTRLAAAAERAGGGGGSDAAREAQTAAAEAHGRARGAGAGSALAATFTDGIDDSLTWDLIRWLRSVCALPVLVKARPLSTPPRLHQ